MRMILDTIGCPCGGSEGPVIDSHERIEPGVIQNMESKTASLTIRLVEIRANTEGGHIHRLCSQMKKNPRDLP